MKKSVTYSTTSTPPEEDARGYDISTTEVVMGLIELALILYVRGEHPKDANSIPVITTIPQMLTSIAEEKKLAICQMGQSRQQVLIELDTRRKEMYFTSMDKYCFEREEKETAWLLLKAHSSKECMGLMHTSESQFRYCVRKMMQKTNTHTRGAMISLIRDEVEKAK